jgi:phosphinothricin acetyltransferase
MHTKIRPVHQSDWDQIISIFQAAIASGNSTFETSAPTWEEWDESHLKNPRLAIASACDEIEKCTVLGWAVLSPFSKRAVYAGVAEVSIYLDPSAQGLGLGEQLLSDLIIQSEAAGIWTLQAGIFPENTASLRLHQKLGFRAVGLRERIGKMAGHWRDTLLLERRSPLFNGDRSEWLNTE